MIVVADTSPLNYLVLIGELQILPALFGRIAMPEAVRLELLAPDTPGVVRVWAGDPPEWVDLHRSSSLTIASDLDLHVGELAAIQLGVDLPASLIMIDEVAGRAEARRRGLEVIGTLGVLDLADARGLTDFKQALAKLRTTTFRASPRLISQFLDRYQTRQGTGI